MLVVVFGLALLTGCTSVRPVETTGGTAAYGDVNKGVRGKVVRLEMRDGTQMNVVGVRVDADSLTWLNRAENRVESIPTRDVHKLSVVKAGSGALRGLVLGVLAGAAIGGARAVMEGDDPTSDPLAVTKDEKMRIYPPAHALYASLATTPLGAILGSRRVYRFVDGSVAASR